MQLEITSIDDIIQLVENDKLNDKLFVKVVETALNCFATYGLNKETKLKALRYWRDEIFTQPRGAETPLFFEIDLDVESEEFKQHPKVKAIIDDFESRY